MPARGPYAKTLRLRERAVDEGITLFSTAGYHGATLTEVADRLGMSLTGLQHHFPTKESLLMAVLEERDRRAAAALPEAPSDLEFLRSLAGVVLDSQRHRGLMELQCVLSAEATAADHPAHDYFRQRYATLRHEAAERFRRMALHGELVEGADPRVLASGLIALVDGLQLQWLLEPGSVDIADEARRYLSASIPALR